MENDWWLLILRNHSQCTTSTSLMKNCSMVKKILIILSEKKVYYIFPFLKVNQCKFKQKETILKLGNPLKSKSKFTKSKIGWGALHWTHWGPSDSRSNFLSVYNSKISPIQGFQSGPVPGTFTRLRSCIVPVKITEPPKISGGQNHKYDGR